MCQRELICKQFIDKSRKVDVYYGEIETAPLIKKCALSMECKLVDTVVSGMNEIFIGKIIGTYTEEKYLKEGKLDFGKMKPIILSQPDTVYWSLGKPIAKAWSIGKKFKERLK
jgi:flavin reductase (DIM6/NTAB) family NADH-FMN oxidoreductase RutF